MVFLVPHLVSMSVSYYHFGGDDIVLPREFLPSQYCVVPLLTELAAKAG